MDGYASIPRHLQASYGKHCHKFCDIFSISQNKSNKRWVDIPVGEHTAMEGHTNEMPINEASQYLLTLGERNAQVYASLPSTRAIIITGSASEGVSDFY